MIRPGIIAIFLIGILLPKYQLLVFNKKAGLLISAHHCILTILTSTPLAVGKTSENPQKW